MSDTACVNSTAERGGQKTIHRKGREGREGKVKTENAEEAEGTEVEMILNLKFKI